VGKMIIEGLWKNIRRGWGEFSSHTRFEIDNGFKIDFGMMYGVGMGPLRLLSLCY
jgi:hypothetical protein